MSPSENGLNKHNYVWWPKNLTSTLRRKRSFSCWRRNKKKKGKKNIWWKSNNITLGLKSIKGLLSLNPPHTYITDFIFKMNVLHSQLCIYLRYSTFVNIKFSGFPESNQIYTILHNQKYQKKKRDRKSCTICLKLFGHGLWQEKHTQTLRYIYTIEINHCYVEEAKKHCFILEMLY